MKLVMTLFVGALAIAFVSVYSHSQNNRPVSLTIPGRSKVTMTGTVIAPQGDGIDLKKVITGPTQFQLGTFPPDSSVTLFLMNSGSNKISWPSGIVVLGQPMPVNSGWIAVVFEECFGQVLAAPASLP